MRTIDITINVNETKEEHYNIPMSAKETKEVGLEILRVVEAATTMHPDWSSMVVTFTNPEANG